MLGSGPGRVLGSLYQHCSLCVEAQLAGPIIQFWVWLVVGIIPDLQTQPLRLLRGSPLSPLGSFLKDRSLETKPEFLLTFGWRILSILSAGHMTYHPTLLPTPAWACPWPPGSAAGSPVWEPNHRLDCH